MRTVVGTTAQVLERRGIALERLCNLTLRRDAFADAPGPTLALAIGERTTYRAGAWLLDVFERLALGDSYPPWGGTIGLAIVAGQVRPVGFGVPGMATHTRTLPADAWAAVHLAALGGPTAVVGVLLRASADAAYRILATSTGLTVVERLEGGTPTALTSVPTPWRVGDVLRAELAWDRLRVYRDQILVADVADPGLPLTGRAAGMVAGRADPTDVAALASFVGGAARQEYVGAGLDLGDVQMVLGQPVRFDLTLSNVAPLGGASRFAALLRHGLNTAGTYDLDRGTVQLVTAVQGGTAPLTTAVGWIDAPSALSEDRVRLDVLGRDAFLTPQLAAGVVTYLAGPPPGGLTPLPPDPCAAADPPEVLPGELPAEPVDPPSDDGLGPEAPDEGAGGGGGGALNGGYLIWIQYRPGDLTGAPPEVAWVKTTAVTLLPNPSVLASHPYLTKHDLVDGNLDPFHHVFSPYCLGSDLFGDGGPAGERRGMALYYAGPDVTGTHYTHTQHAALLATFGAADRIRGKTRWAALNTPVGAGTAYSATARVCKYRATGIHTVADLNALSLAAPDEGSDPYANLPTRLSTVATWTAGDTTVGPSAGGSALVNLADVTIPLGVVAGPLLLGIELVSTVSIPRPPSERDVVYVNPIDQYLSNPDGGFPTFDAP